MLDHTVQRKCYDCGGTMEGNRQNYRYAECGLESVTLVDVMVYHCKCGAIVPEIPAVGLLHQAIALELLRKPSLLAGEEIKFLRKMIGYTASKLAAVMGVYKESVSRWENNKQAIGKECDRLFRFVCLEGLRQDQASVKDGCEGIVDTANKFRDLHLPDILQRVVDQSEGPQTIKVHPDLLMHSDPKQCQRVQ